MQEEWGKHRFMATRWKSITDSHNWFSDLHTHDLMGVHIHTMNKYIFKTFKYRFKKREKIH